MPNKKPRHFFPACFIRLQPCLAGIHSSHFGFSFFLLHVHKLLWKGLCPERLRKMAAFSKWSAADFAGVRAWGKPAIPAAGNVRPKKHSSFHFLRQTRQDCRSPCLPKTHIYQVSHRSSSVSTSDTQIHLDYDWVGDIYYLCILFVIFQTTPSYTCYSSVNILLVLLPRLPWKPSS